MFWSDNLLLFMFCLFSAYIVRCQLDWIIC